jgi:DNA-binding MarR family transcriptional regulator
MQNAGLIQKIRSRKDERVVTILLTEKGKNLQEEALKIPKQIYDCLFKESEEYVALKQLLSTYVSRLSSS